MTLPTFDYVRPSTIDEVLELLAEHRERASILAGGQSLLPLLASGSVHADVVIDLGGLEPVGPSTDDELRVLGCHVTQSDAERCGVTALERVLPWVGHRQTRNRGTICGSLAHGDPLGEIPLAFAVAGSHVVAASRRGRRAIPARRFASGLDRLEPDELLLESAWRHDDGGVRVAVHEITQSTTVVSAIAQVDGGATSVAVSGPRRGPVAFDFADPEPGSEAVRPTLASALASVEFIADRQGSADYRRAVAVELAARAVAECLADDRVNTGDRS